MVISLWVVGGIPEALTLNMTEVGGSGIGVAVAVTVDVAVAVVTFNA
jgi:hypothetical protein